MKKSFGKIIIGIVIISIMSAFIIITINNNKSYTRPDYDYIAIIYHSEMLGIDAGTEYKYYIYKSSTNDNKYFYIKSKANITIAGSGVENDLGSGLINNKNDLKKIMRDIEQDSVKDSQTYISYLYINNGNNKKMENINELGNYLFK